MLKKGIVGNLNRLVAEASAAFESLEKLFN